MKSLFFTLFTIATCQSQLWGSNHINKGDELYNKAKYDSAIFFYKKAISSSLKIEDKFNAHKGLIKSLSESNQYVGAQNLIKKCLLEYNEPIQKLELLSLKTRVDFWQGNYQKAYDLNDSIFNVARTKNETALIASSALNQMARNLLWLSQPTNADSINQEALKWYNTAQNEAPMIRADISNISGIIYYFDGAFEQAIAEFKIAIDTKKLVLNENHPEIAGLYGNIGVMYNHLLQYDKALEYFTYSLHIKQQFLSPTHPRLATSYTNIGIALQHKGNFKRAITAQMSALEIRKLLGENHPKTLDTYEHLGSLSQQLGNYDQAEAYFLKVLEGRIENYGESHGHVEYIYFNLGELYKLQNDPDKALFHYSKALEIGEKIYPAKNYEIARIHYCIGNTLLSLDKIEEARAHFVKSITAIVPIYKLDIMRPSLSDFDIYLRFDEVFDVLIGMSKTFSSGPNPDLALANQYLEIGQKLIKEMQKSFTNEKDRISLAAAHKAINQEAIGLNHQRYKASPQEVYLENIFVLSEASKGLSLLSSLTDAKSKTISNIPDSLLKLDKQYRQRKDEIRSNLIQSETMEDSLQWDMLKKEFFNLTQEQNQFIAELEKDYSKYYALKYGNKTTSVKEVQDYLPRNTALIEYFSFSENRIFATVISKNEMHVLDLQMGHLNQLTTEFISAIQSQDQRADSLSQKLYQIVIAPILPHLDLGIENIVIIADEALSYIPFEILKNGKEQPYLMEDYVISYGLSATLYFDHPPIKNGLLPFLGYAPSFLGLTTDTRSENTIIQSDYGIFRSTLSDLPGASAEVKDAYAIIGGETRLGINATETLFKNEANQYNIIHLATHGIIESEYPDFSKLALVPDSLNDGFLHAYELKNLNLKASLAVLSACESGVGKLAKGEGVMSLSRAFAYAGVPATVVSLWPASDKSTPELMKYFYQNLADGQTKDLALNNARIEYLKHAKGKARHPFYWGGFVLIGDNSPVVKASNIWKSFAYMGVGLVIILFIFVLRDKHGRLPRKEVEL